MTLVEALRDALHVPHPHESQAKVHEIVARQLHEMSPRARIGSTGYFNHSWAPDLIVSGRHGDDRPVFLRFGVRDESFADDLSYLGSEGPMFLDLDAVLADRSEGSAQPSSDVAGMLAESDAAVLVTEIEALDKFETCIKADHDFRDATSQVVFGGKGLVEKSDAETISEGWKQAIGAVETASTESLRSALNQVSAFLTRIARLEFEGTFRSRWVAAGQAIEEFPGHEEWQLDDRAPWEIAELVASLIESGATVRSDQWSAMAKAISASDLGHEMYQRGEQLYGGQVNLLARAGLKHWTAKYAYVPPFTNESFEAFDWSLGHYSIAVNLRSRVAYFTDLPSKWNRVKRTELLPEARSRLRTFEPGAVNGVGLVTPEENVSHELRPTASMPLGERLEQFLGEENDAAWRAARLTSLNVNVPGTSLSAQVDFRRCVVKASESVPLRSLVMLCGRYVAGLTESELDALAASMDD